MPDYNPQEHTPLKKQEVKSCPTCGQLVHPPVTHLEHVMNEYVNPKTGARQCVSSKADELVISGVKMVRSDLLGAQSPAANPQVSAKGEEYKESDKKSESSDEDDTEFSMDNAPSTD